MSTGYQLTVFMVHLILFKLRASQRYISIIFHIFQGWLFKTFKSGKAHRQTSHRFNHFQREDKILDLFQNFSKCKVTVTQLQSR